MKNFVPSILTATFVLLLAFPIRAFAQPTDRNAAVQYLRADVALRQTYPLPPEAWVKLEQVLEEPLSADDEKLVAAASEALTEFQHAAKSKFCDWQMSAEDGPFANTSHRGAVMELVAVSALRVRIRMRDGDHNGAIADVLAAYAAARHLSLDGSIASVLIGYKSPPFLRTPSRCSLRLNWKRLNQVLPVCPGAQACKTPSQRKN